MFRGIGSEWAMGAVSRMSPTSAAAVLALALLGACSRGDEAAEPYAFTPLFTPSWGGMRPGNPEGAGMTVARVRNAKSPDETLEPEPGNVWPAEEAPRATLANPDAALRGIPEYSGPASLPQGARDVPPRDLPSPQRARGSGTEPPLPFNPERPPNRIPPPPPPIAPDASRSSGRVLTTPQGPAVTTGGTARSQSYLGPGGTPGIAVPSGGTTTLFGADGTIQQVPNPR